MRSSAVGRLAFPLRTRSLWIRILGVVAALALSASGGPRDVDAASPRTPDEIRQERVRGSIEDRVRLDLETAGGELDHATIEVVAERGGLVVLSGRVPSSEVKTRAGELARFAVGVSAVQNALEIDPALAPPAPAVRAGPPGAGVGANGPDASPPSDEALAESVARQIARSLPIEARAKHRWLRGWRVEGDAWSFEVDVEDGKVRLHGSVREPVTPEEVVASARSLAAVRAVDVSIAIVDSDRRAGFWERLF